MTTDRLGLKRFPLSVWVKSYAVVALWFVPAAAVIVGVVAAVKGAL